jgi:hypothetical protein
MEGTYWFYCQAHGEHVFDWDAQCTMRATSTGARCRNPVFYSQHWSYASDTDPGLVVFDSFESFLQAAELICPRHLIDRLGHPARQAAQGEMTRHG